MPILLRQPAGSIRSPGAVTEERKVAMTLLIAMVGFFACAFFLSRSYVIRSTSCRPGHRLHGGVQERWSGMPCSACADWFNGRSWLCSAVGLWLVVKVLFVMAG